MKSLNKRFRMSLCVALMLLTASVASSATLLNIDISPYLGGSQTQFSWYFTGDIVSASGINISDGSGAVGEQRTGLFDNLFSFTFASALMRSRQSSIESNDPLIQVRDFTKYTYFVSGAGITTIDLSGGSNVMQIGAITFDATIGNIFTRSTHGFISLGYGQNLADINFRSIANGVEYDHAYVSDSLGFYAPANISYAAGIDSYVLPLAFSSFNLGTYSDGYSVVNVVPEPSTYALFGLGVLALLVAHRRRMLA